MNHSFNIEIAKKYGIEEAIIIENIAFWTKKNIANKKNLKNGRYWIYNSVKAFNELFPYMAEKKIYRVLKKLEEEKVIKSDNFNKSAYDRTKWYTIIDKSIIQIYNLHLPKMENGKDKMGEPIPDINTPINTPINKDKDDTKDFSDDAYNLTQYLYDSILKKVNPPTYKNKLPNLERWADDIDKLIRIDGGSYNDIQQAIDYATSNSFWQGNILSGEKLRKHFNRLIIASKNKKQNSKDGLLERNRKVMQEIFGGNND